MTEPIYLQNSNSQTVSPDPSAVSKQIEKSIVPSFGNSEEAKALERFNLVIGGGYNSGAEVRTDSTPGPHYHGAQLFLQPSYSIVSAEPIDFRLGGDFRYSYLENVTGKTLETTALGALAEATLYTDIGNQEYGVGINLSSGYLGLAGQVATSERVYSPAFSTAGSLYLGTQIYFSLIQRSLRFGISSETMTNGFAAKSLDRKIEERFSYGPSLTLFAAVQPLQLIVLGLKAIPTSKR